MIRYLWLRRRFAATVHKLNLLGNIVSLILSGSPMPWWREFGNWPYGRNCKERTFN